MDAGRKPPTVPRGVDTNPRTLPDLFTGVAGCTMGVSAVAWLTAEGDILDLTLTQIHRELQHEARSMNIRRSSVFYTVSVNPDTLDRTIRAQWSPDPMLGVRLVGGPLDGLIHRLPKVMWRGEEDPYPLQQFEALVSDFGGPMFVERTPSYGMAFHTECAVYRVVGIDRVTDMWVYNYA